MEFANERVEKKENQPTQDGILSLTQSLPDCGDYTSKIKGSVQKKASRHFIFLILRLGESSLWRSV